MDQKAIVVDLLCAILAEALPEAQRDVKWNAPNFSVAGRDLITLNLSPRHPVRVVFHRGAKAVDSKTGQRLVADASGRLDWATDQRAYAGFADAEAVAAGRDWLIGFARAWVSAALGGAE